jgi:hypothetical protein
VVERVLRVGLQAQGLLAEGAGDVTPALVAPLAAGEGCVRSGLLHGWLPVELCLACCVRSDRKCFWNTL